jgi:hypothetical protein
LNSGEGRDLPVDECLRGQSSFQEIAACLRLKNGFSATGANAS